MFYRDIKEQVLDIAGADAGDDFEDMVLNPGLDIVCTHRCFLKHPTGAIVRG